jgi:NAD(P)-dependent dehydrogenase (short-subunit alcohol dehydrogenase family)
MPNEKQRIALIRDSNRGIGFETAMQLARRTFFVVVTARNPKAGKEAARSESVSPK